MRKRNTDAHAPELEFLDRLLTEAVPPKPAHLQAVLLESLPTQRRRALAGYLVRNWLDRVLSMAERGLALAMLVFFGWWLATGYGYDLWHSWVTPTSAVAQRPVTAVGQGAGAPPGTYSGIAIRSASLLHSKPVHALHRVAGTHPELGLVLPVEPEKPRHTTLDDERRPIKEWQAAVKLPVLPTPTVAPEQPAVPTPAPVPLVVDRQPVRISAPAIGLHSPVVEVFLQDGVWQVAEYAVGYLHDTGSAGEGNLVMAGHKGIRGSVFSRLEQLRPGQDIWIDTRDQRFHYQVQSTSRVWPNQVEVLYPTDEPVLTLMTCTNWDTQRFVVRASLVDSAPLPPGN